MTNRIAARISLGGALAIAALLVGAPGCAEYRLGTTLPPGIRSIYIATFINKTSEPNLEFDTTSAMMKEMRTEGTLKVTAADAADATLEVTLTKYELEPLGYLKTSATTPNEYRLHLAATVVLRKTDTGKVVAHRVGVPGRTDFSVVSDLKTDERTALPLAAKDLAHHIAEAVVEYW